MSAPQYIYRLHVEYPEGVDWRNPPPSWEPMEVGPEDVHYFSWPQERRFLSRDGAEHRAERLREWGCTVRVERSGPVTWPDPP